MLLYCATPPGRLTTSASTTPTTAAPTTPRSAVSNVLLGILLLSFEEVQELLYDSVDNVLNKILEEKLVGLIPESPAKSCEDTAAIKRRKISDFYWIKHTNGSVLKVYCDFGPAQNPLGISPQSPASSCQQIARVHRQRKSGLYWVRNGSGDTIQVFCDLTSDIEIKSGLRSSTPGWMRIANVNIG